MDGGSPGETARSTLKSFHDNRSMHASSPVSRSLLLFILFFAEPPPSTSVPNDSEHTEWVIIQTSRVAAYHRGVVVIVTFSRRLLPLGRRLPCCWNEGWIRWNGTTLWSTMALWKEVKEAKGVRGPRLGVWVVYIDKQSHTRDKVGGSKLQLYRLTSRMKSYAESVSLSLSLSLSLFLFPNLPTGSVGIKTPANTPGGAKGMVLFFGLAARNSNPVTSNETCHWLPR